MAKQSGLGDALLVGGYDLSGDTQALDKVGGGFKPLDVTSINQSAFARIGGIRDGSLEVSSFFDPAPSASHPVWGALPRTDVSVVYCRGLGLGSPAAACIAKQVGYDPKRSPAGDFIFKVEALANGYGLEWGEQHTPGLRTDTSATNGTGVDGGAASTFGLQAYLQVTAFSGTSATVKLQSSSDNGAGDAFADVSGGAFAASTGRDAQRIAVTGNIEQYLRVVTSGTFSSVTFAVVVVRNQSAVTF
jgi:hypothetical protein